jgi:hypothetical protein
MLTTTTITANANEDETRQDPQDPDEPTVSSAVQSPLRDEHTLHGTARHDTTTMTALTTTTTTTTLLSTTTTALTTLADDADAANDVTRPQQDNRRLDSSF